MAKPRQLTSKQQHFCRLVAKGTMSQAACYREAFDVGSRNPNTKKETQQAAASRLMQDSMVRARVDSLIKAKDLGVIRSTISAKTRILERLDEAIDDNEFGTNRLRALELYAKCCGLFSHSSLRSTISAKTRILERLDEAIDDNEFGTNRLRALELYAKCCGLFSHSSLTVENKTSNPESVAALLQAKLDQLGLGASSLEDSAPPMLDPSSDDRPADDKLN